MNRWTIEYLETASSRRLILRCIADRKDRCTNPYAPVYVRLTELEEWVKDNIEN